MPKVIAKIEALEEHTELKTQDEIDEYDRQYENNRLSDIMNSTKYDLEPGQEVYF